MRYSSVKFKAGSYIGTPVASEVGIDDGDNIRLLPNKGCSMYRLGGVAENGMRLYAYTHLPTTHKLLIPESHPLFNTVIFIRKSTDLGRYSEEGYRVSELLYDVYQDILKRIYNKNI